MKKFLLICTALCFNALADNNPCQNTNSEACRRAVYEVCRKPNSPACTSAVTAVCQKNPKSKACRYVLHEACRTNRNSVICACQKPHSWSCRRAVLEVCRRNLNSSACISAKITAACQKPDSWRCRFAKMRRNCKTQERYWFINSCKNLNQGKKFTLPTGHTLSGDVYNLQPFQSVNFVTANTKSSALKYISNGYFPTCVNCSVSGSQLTCECLNRGFDSYVTSSIQLKEGDTCISNNNGKMAYC